MLNRSTTTLFRKKFFFCTAFALFLAFSVNAQLITLKNCLDIYRKDTSQMRLPVLKKSLYKDTTYTGRNFYAKTFIRKTDKTITLSKVVFEDSIRNSLVYTFKSTPNFTALKSSMKPAGFALTDTSSSGDNAGSRVFVQKYLRKNRLVTLTRVINPKVKFVAYSLVIKNPADRNIY